MTKKQTHKTISVSMAALDKCAAIKDSVAEYKHLSLSKVADFAIVAGIEAILKAHQAAK